MKYEGYHDDASRAAIPIKAGDEVTIPKGTLIHATGTVKEKKAGRTYKVRVHSLGCGMNYPKGHPRHDTSYPVKNPSVEWVGTGGYWHWVDINDVPEAQKAEGPGVSTEPSSA